MRVSLAVLASALTLQVAQGYGILGHTFTGQIAQLLLTHETARQIKDILSPYYDGLLSKAAPWPDTIKMRPQYRWATVLHYVNTPGDNPPDDCRFEYSSNRRDVVNGIFNMTATLLHYQANPPKSSRSPPPPRSIELERQYDDDAWFLAGSGLSNRDINNNNDDDDQDDDSDKVDRSIREDALRFFVHFMGDLHQPLHTAGKARGGNDAPARWRRAKTNLHRIWDGQLIMKDIKDNFDNDPKAYLDSIMELTTTFWAPSANWSTCDPDVIANELVDNPWATALQPSSPSSSSSTNHHKHTVLHHLCPKAWAREMNALACEYAWEGYHQGRNPSEDQDMSEGHYFDRATDRDHGYLVRRLLAMSGVRMAAILNAIFDPERPSEDDLVHLAASRPWRSSSSSSLSSMESRFRHLRRPLSGYYQTVQWLRDWIQQAEQDGEGDHHAGCSDYDDDYAVDSMDHVEEGQQAGRAPQRPFVLQL
ncbi:hypothetical protein DFQ27_006041 [Actinomortierella ambigua]|uniref:Phospholipase C/P1 nuclease n=1 Tax=Actinomortierella ambigua TaxID=1343610 RepID=A0A9P6UC38_9FUNG|nr:hypothetical protein DFQ27_006041 [Actinomortierella ambigua]